MFVRPVVVADQVQFLLLGRGSAAREQGTSPPRRPTAGEDEMVLASQRGIAYRPAVAGVARRRPENRASLGAQGDGDGFVSLPAGTRRAGVLRPLVLVMASQKVAR